MAQQPDKTLFLYVGCYTNKQSTGIAVYRFEPEQGKFESVQQVTDIRNASFLTIDAAAGMLYAVSEVQETDGQPGGAVACYRIDPESGKLSELGSRQLTHGSDPCYASLAGEAGLLVANYSGSSVALFPLGTSGDGGIGPAAQTIAHGGASRATDRQETPHPHSIVPDKAGRFAVVPDLGMDKLVVYRIDAGQLIAQSETPTAAGAGPRHFAFHPQLPYGYVINELNNTITVYEYDAAEGGLKPIQTVPTLPADVRQTNWPADLHISPDGKFVYGSNRGHDSIAVYAVEPATGMLSHVEHMPTQGRTPRNFGLAPDGGYLLAANQASGNVALFRVNRDNGKLEWTGSEIQLSEPVCIAFWHAE